MRLEDAMARVLKARDVVRELSDKHLILSVDCIYGLRRRGQENLQAASEARHNRGYLARRHDHSLLDELCGRHYLALGVIDGLTHQFDFLPGFKSGVTYQLFQLCDLTFNQ